MDLSPDHDSPITIETSQREKNLSDIYVYIILKVETYTGVTGNTFKQRLGGHRSDIKLRKNRHKSTLADHIWTLKDEGKDYNLEWNLVERAPAFNPTTRKCRVCLKEKKQILYNRNGSSLNKRNEIFNTCRHRKQKLLMNVNT